MSLLGYTEQEVDKMIEAIIIARHVADNKIHDTLTQAIDLLNGLLQEGRV